MQVIKCMQAVATGLNWQVPAVAKCQDLSVSDVSTDNGQQQEQLGCLHCRHYHYPLLSKHQGWQQ
jgi:hypothetical protein